MMPLTPLTSQQNDRLVRQILAILHTGVQQMLPDYKIKHWPPTLPVQAEAALMGYGQALENLETEIEVLEYQCQSQQISLQDAVTRAHELVMATLKQMLDTVEITPKGWSIGHVHIPALLELAEFQVVLQQMLTQFSAIQKGFFGDGSGPAIMPPSILTVPPGVITFPAPGQNGLPQQQDDTLSIQDDDAEMSS